MAQSRLKPTKNPTKRPASDEAPASRSRRGWILGWIVLPAVILGGIFLAGVYVGANLEDNPVTRGVVWLLG